jgi:Uma2 family endonuclease
MMPRTKVKFTYQDYVHLPEDKRYEILEGDLVVAPSPITLHQRISRKLMVFLAEFVQRNNLGEVFDAPYDVVLSEENVLQPDILFISQENSSIITEKNVQGAPDLVIEILSSATEYRDREIKRKIYAKFGVKEYWLVAPERQVIEVMILSENDFRSLRAYSREMKLNSPLLKDLILDLREIF